MMPAEFTPREKMAYGVGLTGWRVPGRCTPPNWPRPDANLQPAIRADERHVAEIERDIEQAIRDGKVVEISRARIQSTTLGRIECEAEIVNAIGRRPGLIQQTLIGEGRTLSPRPQGEDQQQGGDVTKRISFHAFQNKRLLYGFFRRQEDFVSRKVKEFCAAEPMERRCAGRARRSAHAESMTGEANEFTSLGRLEARAAESLFPFAAHAERRALPTARLRMAAALAKSGARRNPRPQCVRA